MTEEPLPQAQAGYADEEPGEEELPSGASLADDLSALFEDGKTYFEAEKAFQKSRLRFTFHHVKRATVLGMAGFALIHAALLALMVGLIIALAPHLTVWGSIALVAGGFIVLGLVFARLAFGRFKAISRSFGDLWE